MTERTAPATIHLDTLVGVSITYKYFDNYKHTKQYARSTPEKLTMGYSMIHSIRTLPRTSAPNCINNNLNQYKCLTVNRYGAYRRGLMANRIQYG